ncbi:hypothetical protein M8J77_006195 [Diaphorina citri]|nr:hypothetical protein M8J77_006195 [Diaphorina citri]
MLDLVFTTLSVEDCQISCTDPLLTPADPLHPSLSISCNLPAPVETLKDEYSIYKFNRGNYSIINGIFSNFDWRHLLSSNSIEDNVDSFYSFVNDVIHCFVPSVHLKKDSYPVWFSSYLKYLLIRKKTVHRLFKATGSSVHYTEFSRLRALCKSISEQCYASYVSSAERNIRENPREYVLPHSSGFYLS